jgi:hypothetical protein
VPVPAISELPCTVFTGCLHSVKVARRHFGARALGEIKEFAPGGRGAPKGETLRAASFPLRLVALLFTGLEQIRRFGV